MRDYQFKTTQTTIAYKAVYILIFMLNITKHMHKDLAIIILTVNILQSIYR